VVRLATARVLQEPLAHEQAEALGRARDERRAGVATGRALPMEPCRQPQDDDGCSCHKYVGSMPPSARSWGPPSGAPERGARP
jgi:hypothetical protein